MSHLVNIAIILCWLGVLPMLAVYCALGISAGCSRAEEMALPDRAEAAQLKYLASGKEAA